MTMAKQRASSFATVVLHNGLADDLTGPAAIGSVAAAAISAAGTAPGDTTEALTGATAMMLTVNANAADAAVNHRLRPRRW
jgi:hypothetical protein